LQLSAFGGATGVFTGIGLAKNLSITAGVDATFRPFFGLYPAVEVRGTYPIDRGQVDGQKNVLAGLVVGPHIGRIQPYGDILAGRGEIDFSPFYPNPADTEVYAQTASVVISPGAGVNYFLTEHFALKGDFQFQHYDSPVTTSGSVYSKAFTIGLTYRLPFGGLGHGRR
jgi:opacity protein-like surface antigen